MDRTCADISREALALCKKWVKPGDSYEYSKHTNYPITETVLAFTPSDIIISNDTHLKLYVDPARVWSCIKETTTIKLRMLELA